MHSAIFSLYLAMSGVSTSGGVKAKHSTPTPSLAASSKVQGLPAAIHSGGWGLV